MKRILALSVVLSVSLWGFDFPFLNTSTTSTGATSQEQNIGESYNVTFDSNGYVNTFKTDNDVSSSNVPWLSDNNSPFDAFDFNPFNFITRRISTKIVNQNFWLILAPNPTSGFVKPSNEGFDVYVSVYDMPSGKIISNTLHFGASSSSASFPKLFKGFKATQASKNARVGFLTCSEYGEETSAGFFSSGTKIYTLYPNSDCSGEVHSCDWEGKGYRICYSSDNFAVRPKEFAVKNIPTVIKAGKEFNLTLDALDAENNPTKEYNETLYTNDNKTVKIIYKIAKAGCYNGNLSLKDNKSFKNGETNATFTYDDMGVLNITITEVNGSEFAKVDENDTDPSRRFIAPVTASILVIPDHFALKGTFKNFNNGNFTYISNDLTMASELDLNITAENKDNKPTKNYNKECYAQNVDFNSSYSINLPQDQLSNLSKIIIKNTADNNETNITIPEPVVLNISRNQFTTDHNGRALVNLKFNFEKNYSEPVNEFDFTLSDINISDANGSRGMISSFNQKSTFRYGRIDVQNIAGYGNTLNTTLRYEYLTNNGWVVNKDHTSTSYGIVDKDKSYYDTHNLTMTLNSIQNGEEGVTYTTSHALPYSTKVHLAVSSWLWYNPLATKYEDPSADNQDCLTHPCQTLIFNEAEKGWGGIGKNNVKSSESRRAIDINSSANEIKGKKEEVNKLNW